MPNNNVVTRAIPIEQVISVQPFIVRRRIAFRDCDPAGVVYTPRFLDPIATSALDLFMGELVGGFGHSEKDAPVAEIGTPAKAVNLTFHQTIKDGDLVDLEVYCSSIRNTTYEIAIKATNESGGPVFDCKLTSVCIQRPRFKAVAVPQYLKDKLQPYLKAET